MCRTLKCKICDGLIKKYIPVYCGRKCKAVDDAKLFKTRQFIWNDATPQERQEHIRAYYEKNVIKGDGCWDWKYKQKRGAYPRMHFNENIPRIPIHQYAYTQYKGEIPKGMFVLHACDNRRCSNPDHLYLGNHQQNMHDMKLRRRQATGMRHGRSKLTNDQVSEIREKLKIKSLNKLAQEYNVAKKTIFNIKHKKTWKQN